MIYQILKHSHSGMRWIALVLLLSAIVNSAIKYFRKQDFIDQDKRLGLLALVSIHIQLLIGLLLFFISPKVIFSAESMSIAMLRFFLIEHTSLMILSIILITIGYSKSKKAQNTSSKHFRLFLFYGLGLLLILVAIPWPWKILLAAGWI